MNIKQFINKYKDDKELVLKTVEEAIENDNSIIVLHFYNYLKKIGDPIDIILELESFVCSAREFLDVDEFHDEFKNDFYELGDLYGEYVLDFRNGYLETIEDIFMSNEIVDFKELKINYILDVLCIYICYDIEIEYESNTE